MGACGPFGSARFVGAAARFGRDSAGAAVLVELEEASELLPAGGGVAAFFGRF